ncbi:MAG: glycosyltransferase family 2 protein [bacterium]
MEELRRLRLAMRAMARTMDGQQLKAELASKREKFQETINWGAQEYLAHRCPTLSAHKRINRTQKINFMILLMVAIGVGIVNFQLLMNVLILVSSVYFFVLFLLRVFLLYLSLDAKQKEALPRLTLSQLPIITILVPLYREAKSLPFLADALEALDYPKDKLDIKIILEKDDLETIDIALQRCGARMYDVIIVPDHGPKTKPKACNHALWMARGSLTVIYDAEDRPETDQLRKAAEKFARNDDELACVQARLNYYNRDHNWLTRLFAIEYSTYFDLILPGLCKLGLPIPLGGTSNFFRTDYLIETGGWDPFNVTEDADLGLRLAARGYRSAMIDSTTYEEAVAQPGPWIRQRSRWIKGFIQTWMVHLRAPLWPFTFIRFKSFLSLHFVVGGNIVSSLINPILWLVFSLTALGVIVLPPFTDNKIIYSFAVVSFLAGNLLQFYIYLLAPLERRWSHYAVYIVLVPFYWIMACLAGYRSLWQFFVKPYYWEKTEHGKTLSIKEAIKIKGNSV